MARHATRNAQQTIYRLYFGTLGTQCKGLRGRLFDSEGGGLSKFVWTDNLFSAWARSGNLFYYFRVNMVNHSPLRQLITRNSNVIESSSIRWNY